MEKRRPAVKAGCGRAGRTPNPRPMDARTERDKRLAEQLRENLRRRKAQAREAVPPAAAAEDGTSDERA